MAKLDWSLIKFQITPSSATTTFHDLSQYITEFSGMDIEALTQPSHGLGDNWGENAFTGQRRVGPITIAGFYDDVAASGPHALLGNATDIGAERVIKVNWGTTNAYAKQDVIVRRYNRTPTRGEFTKYTAELLPASSYVIVAT